MFRLLSVDKCFTLEPHKNLIIVTQNNFLHWQSEKDLDFPLRSESHDFDPFRVRLSLCQQWGP